MPGGGVALVRTADAVESARKKAKNDEKLGFDIVLDVIETPLVCIAENAGVDGDIVVEKVKELPTNQGFNAETQEYVDMVKAGIIDPALVAKTALVNAASVAGLMLTTDVLIADLKDDAEPVTGAVA